MWRIEGEKAVEKCDEKGSKGHREGKEGLTRGNG